MENRGHAQCWCNLFRFPTMPPAWGALFKTRPVWGAAPPLGCRAIQCKVASGTRAAVSLQGATQNRKRSTLATSPGMRVWRSKPGEVLSATLFHNASCPTTLTCILSCEKGRGAKLLLVPMDTLPVVSATLTSGTASLSSSVDSRGYMYNILMPTTRVVVKQEGWATSPGMRVWRSKPGEHKMLPGFGMPRTMVPGF